MMKNSSAKTLFAAASLAAAAWLGSTAIAAAQEVTLRLHQFLPAQANVPMHVLDPWADKVEAESDGRIKIERYAAMALGGTPPQLIDQAQDGSVDIVWTLPGNTPGRFPTTELFELPFMMTNAEATSRAYWDMFEEHMKDTEFADVHIIATWVHGPGVIHSREPVEEMADLEGMKIRAPTRIINALLTELGAAPIGMPIPQVPEALSKNVIDGAVVPWEVTTALRVPELVDNHTEFGGDHALYTTTFVLAMNKDRYESLPDDLKAVIDANSGQDVSALFGKTQQDYDAPGRELAEGNNIIQLSAEDVEEWKAAAEPVIANWISEMDGRGANGQALVDQARELIEKYTAGQ
jgi:TRAP-type C4-dicarboxylate transport system substrate-binding protein